MDGSTLPETRTTCAYCGVGCGVLVRSDGAGGLSVRGDPDHPANLGRLCSKGTALAETLGTTGRLLAPRLYGQDTDWDTALSHVAARFKATIAEHGPDSVAFYVSGQMLTEDYYVANKLMKGFIGSANIDTNSRLCMASTVAGHRRAFGSDTVPGTYEDLELSDLVVLVGSNLAWCHPVLFQRIAAAQAARPGMKVVTIDPRRTATADLADLYLPIAPGADVALFNRLLVEIAERGAFDAGYVNAHVTGLSDALSAARETMGADTGLEPADLDEFLRLWVGTQKVVTVFSQGVNQSSAGADKVNAILNCHLATGRIGKPGMGPFSVTGQPNAMGGREVGGLANMLAAHLEIENPDHRAAVQTFWQSPAMPQAPGLKAVDMFRAVGAGRIKAIWIICTNPAVSMPDADAVRAAIGSCDFVVVSEMFADTETAKLAHVLLPATGWGEKDGTVTNSDRTISRQRAFLPAPGDARHDWDILADVGRRMGWADAFDYATPADIFADYAALTGVAAKLGRELDLSGWAADYDTMPPRRWGQERFFAKGGFYHADGKARMISVRPRGPVGVPSPAFPLLLNTGRIRDQWHTMTRTGRSARLSQHLAEPFLEIHPQTALMLGVRSSDLVTVSSDRGRVILRALLTDTVDKGAVFAPMHWTETRASAGRICTLIAPVVDPVSGQPESKATPVAVARYAPGFYGFAVSTQDQTPDCTYWARARVGAGWRMELAGDVPTDWAAFAQALFGFGDVVQVADPARGMARIAVLRDGRLKGALFAGRSPVAVSRDHLAALLGTDAPSVLAGRPGPGQTDPGPVVCACFSIGVNTILAAIESGGLASVDAIGAALSAGTNCGSCKPELSALLARREVREAAE